MVLSHLALLSAAALYHASGYHCSAAIFVAPAQRRAGKKGAPSDAPRGIARYPAVIWLRKASGSAMWLIGSRVEPVPRRMIVPYPKMRPVSG